MRTRKSFLVAFSYIITIPAVVMIILIDKPDDLFFNFLYRNTVPAAEAVGQIVSYPVRLVGSWIGDFRENRRIRREIEDAKVELQNFQRIAFENEILKKEIAALKDKLKISEESKYDTAVGHVIHDNSFIGQQSFIIRNSGVISAGNAVISNTGFLLGVIVEKTGAVAKIQSLKDSRSNIPVKIAGTDVFGFLYGTGTGDPELRFLSDGDFVPEPGMILITSGVKGNLPNDIPVGKIKEVRSGAISVRLGGDLAYQESLRILLFGKDGKY